MNRAAPGERAAEGVERRPEIGTAQRAGHFRAGFAGHAVQHGDSETASECPDGARRPVGVDTSRASIARVYDASLGGKDNFEVDRRVLDSVLEVAPGMAEVSRSFESEPVGHRFRGPHARQGHGHSVGRDTAMCRGVGQGRIPLWCGCPARSGAGAPHDSGALPCRWAGRAPGRGD
ncbi:SAM-dependent methyltransferase [Nocardia sp. NPDC002869]|uniref:SAM-dependent methyltransferase n=1 Tax=Nocardia sp. NPDC002869 TaxID=3161032 RepID=UPI00398CD20B